MDALAFRPPASPPPLPKPLDPPLPPSVDDHARDRILKVLQAYRAAPGITCSSAENWQLLALVCVVALWIVGAFLANGVLVYYTLHRWTPVAICGAVAHAGATLVIGAGASFAYVGHFILAENPAARGGAATDGPLEDYVKALWANPEGQRRRDEIASMKSLGFALRRPQKLDELAKLCARVTPVLAALEKDEPDFATYTFGQKVEVVTKLKEILRISLRPRLASGGQFSHLCMTSPLKRKFSEEDLLSSKLGKYWTSGSQEENNGARAIKKTRFLIDEEPQPQHLPQPRPRPRPRPKPQPQPQPPLVPLMATIVPEDNLRNSVGAPPPPRGAPAPAPAPALDPAAHAEFDAFVRASGTQDMALLFARFFRDPVSTAAIFPSWKPGAILKLVRSAAATSAAALTPLPALEGITTMGELLAAVGMAGLAAQFDLDGVSIQTYLEFRAWCEEQEAFKSLDPGVKRALALALSWAPLPLPPPPPAQ